MLYCERGDHVPLQDDVGRVHVDHLVTGALLIDNLVPSLLQLVVLGLVNDLNGHPLHHLLLLNVNLLNRLVLLPPDGLDRVLQFLLLGLPGTLAGRDPTIVAPAVIK